MSAIKRSVATEQLKRASRGVAAEHPRVKLERGDAAMVFLRVDAVVVRVPTVERGLAFYRDALGHELLWRRPDAAGLRMRDSRTELVLMTTVDAETDLLVENLDDALASISRTGGTVVTPPLDIDVGRVARICDPFGNPLTLVELSKGRYVTGPDGTVIGVDPHP